jgi:hypothetical protein
LAEATTSSSDRPDSQGRRASVGSRSRNRSRRATAKADSRRATSSAGGAAAPASRARLREALTIEPQAVRPSQYRVFAEFVRWTISRLIVTPITLWPNWSSAGRGQPYRSRTKSSTRQIARQNRVNIPTRPRVCGSTVPWNEIAVRHHRVRS